MKRLVNAVGCSNDDARDVVKLRSSAILHSSRESSAEKSYGLLENINDPLIEELELPTSAYYSLKRAGVERVSDLRKMTEEDNVISVPLILDFSLSAFGKYEGEKGIRYIISRTEQIILISHPKVDYYGGISGINQLYSIVSNPERTSARIEKQG